MTLRGYTENTNNGGFDASGNLLKEGHTFYLMISNKPINGTFANAQSGDHYG